jgi:RHS repeat-associated protein
VRSIDEKFTTNPATGTASLSIPIASSPGRAGFEIEPRLDYDSGAGNGAFGLGWKFSTPTISRKTAKGLPRYLDYEESDVFVLSGAEDLVPARADGGNGSRFDIMDREVDGHPFRIQRYRPRVETAFSRIERWTRRDTGEAHWRTVSGDNVTKIYGRTRQARVSDPDAPERVFSWLLEEVRDDRGNIARYTYKREDGAGLDPTQPSQANRFESREDGSAAFRPTARRYLKRIEYGNRQPGVPGDWLFEVVFDYGEHDAQNPAPHPPEDATWPVRPDAFSSYRSGFEIRTCRLCRRVLMFHHFDELGVAPALVRSTDFEYEERPDVTYLTGATQVGYRRPDENSTYERTELPKLELDYIRPEVQDEVATLDPDALEGTPDGVGEGQSRWVDLDGEGLPGILSTTERAWYYKPNQGNGDFGAPQRLDTLPAPAELAGAQQLTDVGGDGQLDLVQYAPPLQGYFARTPDRGWESFAPFAQLPNVDWSDPNLRFLDLDGDGYPDILITEDEALTWYRSRARDGFEEGGRLSKPDDEEEGPAVVFADGTETIHLADMSGDGSVDIVRVRPGEVCYWPSLGYGRFGRKVTLDHSPRFEFVDQFDPGRVRLTDVDGSGTSDLLYLGRLGVVIYFNQSGNGLSEPHVIDTLPVDDSLSSVRVVDLLGQGTSCLVWSSPQSAHSHPVAYVDLMGGRKPHLLETIENNLGAETRIEYAPSTKFYLQDKAAGSEWLTRLPFPVQVVERVTHNDHVADTELVTRYRYHHGFFDGHEREFRGFGYVEQWDAETFRDGADDEWTQPPAYTRTWFHTGAWLERERLEAGLADEYYERDPHLRLPDTVLPDGLSAREEREAARALRGKVLRKEVYAEDQTPQAEHPYSTSEKNHVVRCLQRSHDDGHAVFFVHPDQTVQVHYERQPHDPRVQHQLVLEVDDFGNTTRSAEITYPRRAAAEPEQSKLWATFTEKSFANRADEPDWYRVGVPYETATYELTGLAAPAMGLFSPSQIRDAISGAQDPSSDTAFERRVIGQKHVLYYADDLSGELPLGEIESRALEYESYRLALTPQRVTDIFGADFNDGLLTTEGHYDERGGRWWAHSGHVVYDADHFYLPVEAVDPFGQTHFVRYDDYDLLVVETEDPLGNKVTAGRRDDNDDFVEPRIDYQALQPALVSDPNRDRTAVDFDGLGRVVATALMGREGRGEGDTLAEPTTRTTYGLTRWQQTKDGRRPLPAFIKQEAREEHGAANPLSKVSYTYVDGSGREAMKRVQAEPGDVAEREDDGRIVRDGEGAPVTRHVDERWVSTGRTVFDNKGNPVQIYLPFFSDTHEYRASEFVDGVLAETRRYDSLGRQIRTEYPDGTHTRVEFDAWKQETWDENDSIEGTPWLARMQAGGGAEKRAADLTLAHASTQTVAHLDTLGRTFLTVADKKSETLQTRVELDVQGNQLSVTDARTNVIARHKFDLLGRKIWVDSADAGRSTTLLDIDDRPVRSWEARGQKLRHRYDALRRPTHLFVEEVGDDTEKLVRRTVYGESHPDAYTRRLRGQAHLAFDGAGLLVNQVFDFKGNLLEHTRRLAGDYTSTVDWSDLASLSAISDVEAAAESLLEDEDFTISATYDALDRVTSRTTPDGNTTIPSYNEANLLDAVEVDIDGEVSPIVADISYNERGQRTSITYGNGAHTTYTYDRRNRLETLRTERTPGGTKLQDLTYTYDAVGNVVEVADAVSYGNPSVSADGRYTYDALYRLVAAEGREHPGQQPTHTDPTRLNDVGPNDMQGLRRYYREYAYDAVGNIEEMVHRQTESGPARWTRAYKYADDSNRLLQTSAPGDPAGTLSHVYGHDDAGNIDQMPHLSVMSWDFADRLQATATQVRRDTTPETTYYTYGADGQRVRKVTDLHGADDGNNRRKCERIYLGGFEIYREYESGDVSLERQTLHVMDDARRVALLETKTKNTSVSSFSPGPTHYRYQLTNHLDSAMMELDEAAEVITYEEYFPFGGTSMHAADADTKASAKRYRYTGKERDTETGFYYHGARYYAPWLGRWTAADPAGMVDGPNRYLYSHNSPLNFVDPEGTDAIYVAFPDYEIAVGSERLRALGHAGVVLIDEETGHTRYYEYGRYDSAGRGIVRRRTIPNLEMRDGEPTDESLRRVLASVARQSGHDTKLEGAYVEGADFDDMKDYAESRQADNSDDEREPYDVTSRNCGTFAQSVIEAGGADVPAMVDPRPASYVDEIQEDHTRVAYDPATDRLERGGDYDSPGWLDVVDENQSAILDELDRRADDFGMKAAGAADEVKESVEETLDEAERQAEELERQAAETKDRVKRSVRQFIDSW